MPRTTLLARATILAAALAIPSCIIASKNNSSTKDVEKVPSDPPIPESLFVALTYDASGLTEPVYEAPRDRAFVIRDLRASNLADILIELPGVPPVLHVPVWGTFSDSSRLRFVSNAGIKLPPSAKLRLRRYDKASQDVEVFVAGELVRL